VTAHPYHHTSIGSLIRPAPYIKRPALLASWALRMALSCELTSLLASCQPGLLSYGYTGTRHRYSRKLPRI